MKNYFLICLLLTLSTTTFAREDVSSSGAVFKRNYLHPELGEAWEDPSGMIWGDTVIKNNKNADFCSFSFSNETCFMFQPRAREYCESIGAKLPSREDFERLGSYLQSHRHYLRQILPFVTRPSPLVHIYNYFWSSTRDEPILYNYYFSFNRKTGGFDSNPRYNILRSVVCVL